MKLARFNTLNEAAKKAEKVELEKKVMDFLQDELTKNKMSRSDMVKKCNSKFEGEKELKKVVSDVIDDLTHDPLLSKIKVQRDTFVKDKDNVTYYYIGDKAKDPSGVSKYEKKERQAPGPKKEKKVKKFDEFKTKEEKESAEKEPKLKFGSPEWREKYGKKAKKKEEPKKEETKKEEPKKPKARGSLKTS